MTLARAASSLGAAPVYVFFSVTLPLILPGVVSGALFAFATSFDEVVVALFIASPAQRTLPMEIRSEEHTSELQSLMRISYAVFCLKKKTTTHGKKTTIGRVHTLCKTCTSGVST